MLLQKHFVILHLLVEFASPHFTLRLVNPYFIKQLPGHKSDVKDDFSSFEEIGILVFSSDKILLPYNLVDMSSGSIAYAAQFNKPVYVPSTGLLSKLVKKYKIGKVVDDFSDVSFLNDKIDINSNYCIDHTVEKFYKQLLNIK